MSISDEHIILTIERMQIELRRAMEDIQVLTLELQKRISVQPVIETNVPTVAPRMVIKLKKVAPGEGVAPPPVKKLTGLAPWNAYVAMIRAKLREESADGKVDEGEVKTKAKALKDTDPDVYKTFRDEWLTANDPTYAK